MDGAPEVVEVAEAEQVPVQVDVTQAEQPVRVVAEAGTNMSISANAAALEL